MRHPIQPLGKDGAGVLRFKKNPIVRRLLDNGPFDLNDIAMWDVSEDDQRQFAQLIGYSLSGFSELSYVDEETYTAAKAMALGYTEEGARIETLRAMLKSVKESIKDGIAELFEIHPSDLEGGF